MDIRKGEKFSNNNLWVKRPGNGDFSAYDYQLLLGKIAARDIKKNAQIKKEDVN